MMLGEGDISIHSGARRLLRRGWVLLGAALIGVGAAGLAGGAATTKPAMAPTTAPATRPTSAPAGARVTPEGWFAPRPEVRLPPLPEKVTAAFVLPIREPITPKTFDALERKIVQCRAGGAQLIVFDMDTWGGDALAALDIAREVKANLSDIRTVCYARTRAISAGALIAMACNEIVMAHVGKLGDCAPISMGEKLEGLRREKIETVLRADFEESAELHGYSPALAVAMVSHDLEVWLVRNKATRELRYVLSSEYRGRVEIPPGLSEIKSNPKGPWELLQIVVPKDKLLTMTPKRAVEYGFAKAIIDAPRDRPLSGLMSYYSVVSEPKVFEDVWSETLVAFLTTPAVTGILMFVGILGIYIELNTPGVGLPGAVAVLAFALLFGSRYLTNMAQWWEIALFVVGVALLFLEVFVTPGFGVLGILGILCCFFGLMAMVVPNAPDKLPLPKTELDWSLFKTGLATLGISFLAAVAAAILLARYLPKVPLASKLLLTPATPPTGPASESAAIRSIEVGQTGTVHSICRPVGQVRFGEQLVDAVAEGAFIPAGARVKVVRNEGNRVVVTPTES